MQAKASMTISPFLISHVRLIYEMALEDIVLERNVRTGVNGYTHHALPAYVIAVAAVEAFVNETFLSCGARGFFKESPLWDLPTDWIEKIELGNKLILIPQLLFGRSLSRETQPYQNMALLIKVRNGLVHYKMKGEPPKYLRSLDERGISLTAQSRSQNVDYPWPLKLSSSEGIRWAHNTACETVQAVVHCVTGGNYPLEYSAQNFELIPDSYARDWLRARGIDPDSNSPE